MKKITILALVLIAFSSTSVFAWDAGTNGEATVGTDVTAKVKLSKSVSIDYAADTTTDGLGYAVATYHSSGTKTFGSSSGDSAIWVFEGTGEAAPDAPTGTDSADFSGWNSL